jgi:hypothetical protein
MEIMGAGKTAFSYPNVPVLQHPLVQGVHRHRKGEWILRQGLLQNAAERRPHQGPVDPELLHQLVTGLYIIEGVQPGDRPALQGIALLATGRRHPLKRRIRHRPIDPILNGDASPIPLLDVLDQALVGLRQELGERIGVLVHVVVHVEHREAQAPVTHEEQLLVRHRALSFRSG